MTTRIDQAGVTPDLIVPQGHADTPNDRTWAANTFLLLIVAVVIAALAIATATWGPVALAMTALATVPVVFVVLFLITLGK